MRLKADADQRFTDRALFLRAAASAMRRTLIDHARRKGADKRGGKMREETLDGVARPDRPSDALAIGEALDKLTKEDARKATIVELRFWASTTKRSPTPSSSPSGRSSATGRSPRRGCSGKSAAEPRFPSRLGPDAALRTPSSIATARAWRPSCAVKRMVRIGAQSI